MAKYPHDHVLSTTRAVLVKSDPKRTEVSITNLDTTINVRVAPNGTDPGEIIFPKTSMTMSKENKINDPRLPLQIYSESGTPSINIVEDYGYD